MTPLAVLVLLLAGGLSQMETIERIQRAPPAAAGPQEAPVGKAILSGKVVNTKTKEPIKKARVVLNGPANLNAVTDSSGSFTFRALPPGSYVVSASHEDFYLDPGGNGSQVALSGEEEKQGLEVKLIPGAAVTGRVLDEDELPVPQCSVSAMRFDRLQTPPRMVNINAGSTDDEGRYRLHTLPQGRYVLKARCETSFPAPHGFMKRGDPLIPHEGYAPVFLGEGDAASPLAGFPVGAGAELSGVDFHVKRIPVFAVSGTISGLEPSLLSGAQVMLIPHESAMPDENAMTAAFEPPRGRYVFRHVPAGSYELVATVFNADHAYEGRQSVDVGKTQLTEFQLKLTAGAALPGTIEVDQPGQRFDNLQLSLQPLETDYRGPYPMATISSEGSFEFKAVLPGRFRLNHLPMGYIKSLSIAGRDVSPQDFEVTGEGSGPMRIVVGSKMGRIDMEASPRPPAGQPLSAVLVSESNPGQRNVAMAGPNGGELSFSVAPGKYRILVVAAANVWSLMNQPQVLDSLESHTVEVEVAEGDTKRVPATVLSPDDLQKALDAAE